MRALFPIYTASLYSTTINTQFYLTFTHSLPPVPSQYLTDRIYRGLFTWAVSPMSVKCLCAPYVVCMIMVAVARYLLIRTPFEIPLTTVTISTVRSCDTTKPPNIIKHNYLNYKSHLNSNRSQQLLYLENNNSIFLPS